MIFDIKFTSYLEKICIWGSFIFSSENGLCIVSDSLIAVAVQHAHSFITMHVRQFSAQFIKLP